MKIYKYYRNDKKLQESGRTPEEKYPLHAITTDKGCAQFFEASRDMSKFIKKVYKGHGDDSDVILYMNKHRGQVLDWYELTTYKPEGNCMFKSRTVEVLMTDMEYEILDFTVERQQVLEEMQFISPNIFKRKIVDALRALGYTQTYALVTAEENDTDKYWGNIYSGDIVYDELELFIKMNIDILSIEGFHQVVLEV